MYWLSSDLLQVDLHTDYEANIAKMIVCFRYLVWLIVRNGIGLSDVFLKIPLILLCGS